MDDTSLTNEAIAKMSYTEFIAFVYQWNVPPGAFSTINEWAIFSRMNSSSRVLEMACTTGFSGRELALFTDCSVVGIDLCAESIEVAKYNQLLRIEEELGRSARYAGKNAFHFLP